MRNITGQAAVGDDLFGRTYELQRLWEKLEQGEHILMLAPRRVGKTSLMQELDRVPRENWDVFYADVQRGEGPADCIAAILASLATDHRYRSYLTRFHSRAPSRTFSERCQTSHLQNPNGTSRAKFSDLIFGDVSASDTSSGHLQHFSAATIQRR